MTTVRWFRSEATGNLLTQDVGNLKHSFFINSMGLNLSTNKLSVADLEFLYFSTRSGLVGRASIADHKAAYYLSHGGYKSQFEYLAGLGYPGPLSNKLRLYYSTVVP